jgi:hypothetical protein
LATNNAKLAGRACRPLRAANRQNAPFYEAQRTARPTGKNEQNGLFRRLIGMNRKTNGKKPLKPLAQGQRWKTKDAYIEIVELGKRLIHYRMVRQLGQMRRTQTSAIDTMSAYLKSHQAQLVKGSSNN